MTRINLVRPEDLADQHLFAEWRESKMIVPAALRSLKAGTALEGISPKYTLNAGHVKFFYSRLLFVRHRFINIGYELKSRGYSITHYEFDNNEYYSIFSRIPQIHTWAPTKDEIQININRIAERLNERPDWYRYYGDVYSPEFFIDRYNQELLVDDLTG